MNLKQFLTAILSASILQSAFFPELPQLTFYRGEEIKSEQFSLNAIMVDGCAAYIFFGRTCLEILEIISLLTLCTSISKMCALVAAYFMSLSNYF